MHKLQPNIVTILVIHILLVCCVETAPGVGENEVRCYDCDPPDSDAKRNVTQLITSKGYPCEDYTVVTADGFILSLQRIPYGKKNFEKPASRPVVFLQHGLLDSAATWVMNMADQSLGFILADAGFDVWMGNVRGNTYSRAHVKYKPSEAQFWDWSWDEMANYDLPALLNYVLNVTSHEKLFYVGHSQGALIAFARLSHDHVLASKIRAFIALGPIATVGHIKGLAKYLSDASDEEETVFRLFGIRDFLPNNEIISFLSSTVCRDYMIRYLCENFVFLISGFDERQMNATRLPVYFTHAPAGTSVKNVVHFAQMTKSNLCQAYNYGSAKTNFLHYNKSSPPVYNISAITVPTYIFSAGHDFLADPTDVRDLTARLHSVVYSHEFPHWQHIDFVWALDAARLLYHNITSIIQRAAAS